MVKKALLVLLALFLITGCDKKEVAKKEEKDIFEVIDEKFKENNLSYVRDVELNADDYYAKIGWQYAINDSSCIVDIYYFGEDSNIYKDALQNGAIRAKQYDNQYFSATVNKGMAAIIWDGCNNTEFIKNILLGL